MKTAHIQARLTRLSNQINVNLGILKDVFWENYDEYHRKRLELKTALLNRDYNDLKNKYQDIL